jgi:hypothetical protein
MLAIPDKLYKSKKLPNMCFLNGTDSRKGYGYGYGYGKQSKEKFGIKII